MKEVRGTVFVPLDIGNVKFIFKEIWLFFVKYIYIYILNSGTVSVGATSSTLKGCSGLPCTGVGITGTAGACVCNAGYYGTAIYSNGAWRGCTACSGNFNVEW